MARSTYKRPLFYILWGSRLKLIIGFCGWTKTRSGGEQDATRRSQDGLHGRPWEQGQTPPSPNHGGVRCCPAGTARPKHISNIEALIITNTFCFFFWGGGLLIIIIV